MREQTDRAAEECAPATVKEIILGFLMEYHAKWCVTARDCLWQAHVTHSLNGVYLVIKTMDDQQSKPIAEWTVDEVEAAWWWALARWAGLRT